jgi:hypothetical protein
MKTLLTMMLLIGTAVQAASPKRKMPEGSFACEDRSSISPIDTIGYSPDDLSNACSSANFGCSSIDRAIGYCLEAGYWQVVQGSWVKIQPHGYPHTYQQNYSQDASCPSARASELAKALRHPECSMGAICVNGKWTCPTP